MFQPEVRHDKAISVTGCNNVWERSRLEWRVGDVGNPAVVTESFLSRFGLGVPGTATGHHRATDSDQVDHSSLEICGATLFLSAAAGAAMLGVPAGAPSPAPAVPDLVIIVFAHADSPVPLNSASADAWRLGAWDHSWTPAQHAAAVDQVRAAIAQGDVYQVTVVGHASAPYLGDPLPALRRVTALPGARYPSLLTGAGWALASASPEMVVRVSGALVETRPIKGTRPATAEGRAELLTSAKERAEHIMIVDLERNDLARIARTGSVQVPRLFAVRQWCDLWQGESRVTAELAPGVGLADVLRAVLPGGSVTGAPKLAALAEIAGLEPVGRGPSMGALGWVGHRGLDLGLTIRTVAVDGERVHLWAGGGITWDSDPEAEVGEAAAKAAPIRAALAPPLQPVDLGPL